MQDPITNQLIDSAWSDIQGAVTSGLAMAVPFEIQAPALNTVFVVSEEKPAAASDWKPVKAGNAPYKVRVAQSGEAFDVMHRLELSYYDLRAPDKDKIEAWATAARQFELNLALRYYATHAAPAHSVDKLLGADPDGWGQRRCVAFKVTERAGLADKWNGADMERLIRIDDAPVERTWAMVFRTAGGPYIRRPADLSLSWTPADECGAELLLTEQLEFAGMTESAVYSAKLAASQGSGG